MSITSVQSHNALYKGPISIKHISGIWSVKVKSSNI